MNETPSPRKRPAHFAVVEQSFRSNIIFLTVCAQDRKPIFANEAAHGTLLAAWQAATAWRVGRYTIMPDHIHLFCAPASLQHPPLAGWVQYWKSLASRQWPHPHEQPIWQRDHWDRQLRSGESYGEKWAYVRKNPVRKGLVASADAWPYQGEPNVLWWHD